NTRWIGCANRATKWRNVLDLHFTSAIRSEMKLTYCNTFKSLVVENATHFAISLSGFIPVIFKLPVR
ncbi:MAG: hypothetical protein N6V49_03175, partial [Serratia symbiotica]|nr:hypothetical protein [Serratia symbiotica]